MERRGGGRGDRGRGGGRGGSEGGAGRGYGRGDGAHRGGGTYASGGGGRGDGRGDGSHQRGRGFRGGGQRGGQIRRDVRQLCQTVNVLPTIAGQRKHGSVGDPIELIANHYRIGFKDISCFHYDIEIKLERNDGQGFIPIVGPQEKKLKNELKMDNIRVIEKMANEWPDVFTANRRPILYVFDGQKNLYCGQQLNISQTVSTRRVVIQLDGFQEQKFEIRIKFANQVLMNVINDYLSGSLKNPTSDQFREAIQVLEIMLRYIPTQSRVPVGRSLFSRQDRRPICFGKAEIGFGHYQSVQMTETGLTLNIDRSATLFRSAGTLQQFIERELNLRPNELSSKPFDNQSIAFLNRKIKGLKIFTTHILNQKRRYFIDCMSELKPNECHFTVRSKDGTTESSTTVEKYFKDEYKLNLNLRNVPCIQLKGGSTRRYLPVDVCHVYEDQPLPRSLIDPNMTREIVSVSNSQRPAERFSLNQESAEVVANESQQLMDSFGVQLVLKPIKLSGRVLKGPELLGNDRRLKTGKELNRWLFYNLSQKVAGSGNENWKQYFQKFFGDLIQTGRGMGVTIQAMNMTTQPSPAMSGPYKSMSTIESALKRSQTQFKGIQMVFFCIPMDSKIYEAIKYFGDIEFGIATQCINEDNFIETPRGFFNNILLKINAKLDGQNQVLKETVRPDVFTKAKNRTIVVGMDVTHPGTNPLANERVISSIAASVGSFDSEFSKFTASIAVQPMNTEIVQNFDAMFGRHLKHFKQNNSGNLPTSVILFRDGVSEGQFPHVTEREIPLIEKAFMKMDPKLKPKITVFVVQKRHHTRLMPFKPTFDDRGREQFNIPAGTVVDHTITNPLNNEFHLASHKGMLGTSRHAKYVCLRDDHKMSEDQKQLLSYYLCHTYCRCTKSISIPTPVMYAHLAAFRAKQHISAQNIRYEEKVSGESDDQKREREGRNIALLNSKIEINPKLVSLPYYS